MIMFPSFGFQVSIGTVQDYWQQNQLSLYSARDVGWIPSVLVYLGLALGIFVGPLSDRFGPRHLAAVGSGLWLAMIFLLAECREYWQFLLCCGFLGGIATATLTVTSLVSVSHWFKAKRALVSGIAMAGSSFGGFAIPLILRSCLPKYGYQWTIRILGFIFSGCLVTGNLLLRARIKPSVTKKPVITLSLFSDLRLSLFAISVFGFEIVLFGGLGILPTYATVSTDFPPETGFYLISVLNGVSCFGRLLLGYVADKIGRFNMLSIMSVFTLVFVLGLWLPFGTRSLPILYTFVALFGFGTGSWMALVPACVGQLCRAEDFGRYYGTMYFVASLSTLICMPISGELLQTVGPQALISFFCAVLVLSITTFSASRWACLGWHWEWLVKV